MTKMSPEDREKYPQHAKYEDIGHEAFQYARDLLEDLHRTFIFCKYGHSDGCGAWIDRPDDVDGNVLDEKACTCRKSTLEPKYFNRDEYLYEFFDIDMWAFFKEKDRMLAEMQAHMKGIHNGS